MALLPGLLRTRPGFVLLTALASAATAAVTLLWNWRLSAIINTVSAGEPPAAASIAGAAGLVLVTALLNYAKGWVTGYTCENMTHGLRMGYARRLASLPFADAEQLNAGERMSALQNEITGVSGYLNSNLTQLLDDGVRFIATFGWLLYLNPLLTLAADLPAFAIMAYIFWSSKIIGAATERSRAANASMNTYADTLLTLFPVIRLYDAARLTLGGYSAAVADWRTHTVRAERTKARLMSLSGVLGSIPLILLFAVGGHMAIGGTMSVGTLYIFINLSGNVSGVLMNMPGYIAAARQFAANAKRIEGQITL